MNVTTRVPLQICFYAWGFYAMGDDDTLEIKLIGQSTTENALAASSASSEPRRGLTRAQSSKRMGISLHRMNSVAAIDVQFGNTLMTPVSAPGSGHVATGIETDHSGRDGDRGGEVEAGAVGEPLRLREGTGVLPPAVETAPASFFKALKRFEDRLRRSEQGKSTAIAPSDARWESGGDSSWEKVHHRISVVLVSPNIISVVLGIAIAMISHLQQRLFHNPQSVLRPLGAALEVRAYTTVVALLSNSLTWVALR